MDPAGERLKAGINWISDFSAFGFSLAAGLTAGIGQVILDLDLGRWNVDDDEEPFVYLPVAIVLAFIWYLLWLYSMEPTPEGRKKNLGRVFAVINTLLLWGVAAGFDLSGTG
jgi:hypothetical protein